MENTCEKPTREKRVGPLTATKSPSLSIAFTALSIALIAVCAWITVPLGPIPFTMQMFAISFMIQVLTPKQALGAILGYLCLGALGVPVFSGMRGGIGILLGPTGGYLWGYILGVAGGSLLLSLFRRRGMDNFATGVLSGLAFVAIAYLCGCIQYAVLGQISLWASFLVTGAPFIVVDLAKVIAATFCAQAVIRAVPRR